VLVRVVIAAALVIAGVLAGIGLMIPVASGNAPSWLSFATNLVPARTATIMPTPMPTATPQVGGFIAAGTLAASIAPCQAGATAITLRNTGTAAANWTLGAADTTTPLFAVTPTGTAQATASGTLAPGVSTTIYLRTTGTTAPYHILLISGDGAAQALAGAC
jgi:hypothetical protein